MSAKYRLRYLPIAQEDLVEIFDDIAQDSPDRALSFVEKLDKKIRLLEHHPLLDRVLRHSKLQEYGYRVLILESHLIFSFSVSRPLKCIELFMVRAISIISSNP